MSVTRVFDDEETFDSPQLGQLIGIEAFLHEIYDPSAERLVLRQLKDAGDELEVFGRSDVPLKVVADLVDGWRNQQARGNWPLDAIHWCARIPGKRSWLVATLDPDPTANHFRVWRVSYGGKGKRVPTVKEVARYRRTFERVPLRRASDPT